jgi:hypothetical protein
MNSKFSRVDTSTQCFIRRNIVAASSFQTIVNIETCHSSVSVGSTLLHEVFILCGKNHQVTYVSLLELYSEGPLFASRPRRSV